MSSSGAAAHQIMNDSPMTKINNELKGCMANQHTFGIIHQVLSNSEASNDLELAAWLKSNYLSDFADGYQLIRDIESFQKLDAAYKRARDLTNKAQEEWPFFGSDYKKMPTAMFRKGLKAMMSDTTADSSASANPVQVTGPAPDIAVAKTPKASLDVPPISEYVWIEPKILVTNLDRYPNVTGQQRKRSQKSGDQALPKNKSPPAKKARIEDNNKKIQAQSLQSQSKTAERSNKTIQPRQSLHKAQSTASVSKHESKTGEKSLKVDSHSPSLNIPQQMVSSPPLTAETAGTSVTTEVASEMILDSDEPGGRDMSTISDSMKSGVPFSRTEFMNVSTEQMQAVAQDFVEKIALARREAQQQTPVSETMTLKTELEFFEFLHELCQKKARSEKESTAATPAPANLSTGTVDYFVRIYTSTGPMEIPITQDSVFDSEKLSARMQRYVEWKKSEVGRMVAMSFQHWSSIYDVIE